MPNPELNAAGPFIIRPIEESDMDRLSTLSRLTFSESFARFNTTENMRTYMDAAYTIPQLTYEWQQMENEFFLAIYEGTPVGYLKLTHQLPPAELNIKDASLEIARIYVLKSHQKRGIGQAFMRNTLAIAQKKKYTFIWLGVATYNPNAIAFYQKCGFKELGRKPFVLGTDIQMDILMGKVVKVN